MEKKEERRVTGREMSVTERTDKKRERNGEEGVSLEGGRKPESEKRERRSECNE